MASRFGFSSLKRRVLSALILIPAVVLVVIWGGYVFGAVLGVAAGLALAEIWQMAKRMQGRWLVMALGVLYVAVSFLLCYRMRLVFGAELTVLFFAVMWLSDTGAYFFGKFIGGAKMVGAMSPNKTWSGYAGAMIVPALVLWPFMMDQPAMALLGGMALGATGQAGDLVMSLLKRQAQVKDSGALIPGHGGLLDRIDSLMPAVPVYMALLTFLGLFL